MCSGKKREDLFMGLGFAGSYQWSFFAGDHVQTVRNAKKGELCDKYLAG